MSYCMFNRVTKSWHISNHSICSNISNKMREIYKVLSTISKYTLFRFVVLMLVRFMYSLHCINILNMRNPIEWHLIFCWMPKKSDVILTNIREYSLMYSGLCGIVLHLKIIVKLNTKLDFCTAYRRKEKTDFHLHKRFSFLYICKRKPSTYSIAVTTIVIPKCRCDYKISPPEFLL